jgi:hypothetical protein
MPRPGKRLRILALFLGFCGVTALSAVVFLRLLPGPGRPAHFGGRFEREAGSEAYEALNLWAAERAYPNPVIPDLGQALAFSRRNLLRPYAAQGNPYDDLVSPWTSIGPTNIGGRTLAVAVRPDSTNVLFAGSASGGLWKSVTAGVGASAWTRIDTGYPVQAVSSIAIDPRDPEVMYVGTGEVYRYQNAIGGDVNRSTRGSYGVGILKSTDGGATWSVSLDWSLAQSRGVWAVRIHPQDSSILYAGTTEGVYKSTDAGASWHPMLNVVMAMDVSINPAFPETVFAACGNFGSGGTGIYRTVDGGGSWSRLAGGLPSSWNGKASVMVAPSAPHIVFASVANASAGIGLYKSVDDGVHWVLANAADYPQYQGWYSHFVAVSPGNVNRLFTGGIDVWKSDNAGATLDKVTDWEKLALGTPPPGGPEGPADYVHADVHSGTWDPVDPNTIYFGTDGGVFRTTDGGTTFEGLNGGYVTSQFYQGFSNSALTADLAIGGMQDNLTAIYEGSPAWRRVIGGDGCWAAIDSGDDDVLYGSAQGLLLFRSDDFGQNWNDISPPNNSNDITAFVAPYVLAPSLPSRIYAGRAHVYRSDDRGAGWSVTNGGNLLDGENPVFSIAVAWGNPDLAFAATAPNGSRGRLFRTLNGGTIWTDVTGTLPDRYIGDIAIDPSNDRNVYVAIMGFGTSHVYRSIDRGDSWIDFGAGLPDVPASAVAVDPARPSVVYVGNDLGVYVSPYYRLGWYAYMEGMPPAMINDLVIARGMGTIRAATHGNGVYERALLPIGITAAGEPPGERRPAALALAVAPNPLRASGRVTFTLPEPARVRAVLVDASGREAAVLADRAFGAGEQSLPLSASGLARGVYFLELTAGETTAATRVVFLR